MTAGPAMRVVAVLDGTVAAAERRARALGGFLREGVRPAPAAGLTIVFYAHERDRERLVGLAPTRDVHLLRAPPRRPDLMAAALAAFARDTRADLFVFAGGPLGTELAARLAHRAGGTAVTEALGVAAEAGGLVCRRNVYSNHLSGSLLLGPRPWCVTTGAGWYDADAGAPVEHRIVADALVAEGADAPPPLEDVERLESPATGDLETARFLVVAGRGAGSKGGVERLAAAAARMGAAFGVTRPVAMNAWAPMDRLIGVSGSRATPSVCIVAGASGAPAFFWGIERAGFIAAIDPDEHAAIVSAADAAVLDDGVAVAEALAGLVAGERRDTPA